MMAAMYEVPNRTWVDRAIDQLADLRARRQPRFGEHVTIPDECGRQVHLYRVWFGGDEDHLQYGVGVSNPADDKHAEWAVFTSLFDACRFVRSKVGASDA